MRNDSPSHQNQTGTAWGRPPEPTVASQMTTSFRNRLWTRLPVGVVVSSRGPLRAAIGPSRLPVWRRRDRGKVMTMKKTETASKTEAEWKRDLTPMQYHV